MTKMVKVNLNFSDKVYESVKLTAKKHNTSVSGYLELLIDSECRKSQFLKYAGTFHFGPNASDNGGIDEAICDEIEGKLR